MRQTGTIFLKCLVLFTLVVVCRSIFAQNEADVTPTSTPVLLKVVEQRLLINGKPTLVYNIVQPDGTSGYIGVKGQQLNVIVENDTHEAISLHWQGLILPNNLDGAPFITQKPIPPGGQFNYRFPLIQTGTFLLHSHYKTQQQRLMAAPVMIDDPAQKDQQDVVMFLQDFAVDPQSVYAQFKQKILQLQANIQLSSDNTDITPSAPLAFDAYLTNRRTLLDPDIVKVTPNTTIRLRVINAATNSNFWIDLGALKGRLVKADSEEVAPLENSLFQIAHGQRLEIEIPIPAQEASYPILAQAEGTDKLTGLILVTPQAQVKMVNGQATHVAANLDYSQETQLRARYPLLPHAVTKSYTLNYTNNPVSYAWTVNGETWPNTTPITVNPDDRTELTFNNQSDVAIPIDLHGHLFQITAINNAPLNGAIRDTVLVLPHSAVTVQFDADNPGVWLLHGSVPYQNYDSVTTLVKYNNFTIPLYPQKDTGIPPTN